MAWYFTADLHLGHANIIKYCKRPFLSIEQLKLCDWIEKKLVHPQEVKVDKETVEKMDQTIIDSINTVVDKDDNLVIIGDFCLSKNSTLAVQYRDRIACKNIYLILGNHDDRKVCAEIFKACYENYLFKINGQYIFADHYPCRSWNKAAHGSWMLYGHVHNALNAEDNGRLLPYEERIISEGLKSVLQKYNVEIQGNLIQELIDTCSSVKGMSLTLDVGIDNTRPNKPFGTPWSFEEVRKYMLPKTVLWNSRQQLS